jgi:hypothetical protein
MTTIKRENWMEVGIYFWPPCVVVAPPCVVVRRQIYRDLERFPKSSYGFEIHFREIMTGVIFDH